VVVRQGVLVSNPTSAAMDLSKAHTELLATVKPVGVLTRLMDLIKSIPVPATGVPA
jgi:hypothetical protein